MTRTNEGKDSVLKYQEYMEGQLHQVLSQTYDCDEAKEIAQEALRWLKIKQILKHQPRVYQTRKERSNTKRQHTPSPSNEKPRYAHRDMSHEQFDDWDPPVRCLTQDFNAWQLCDNYYQPSIDADVYSRPEGDVTALAPLVIPEQPEGEWFDALADTPAVATPLETLSWLRTPNSPSLGKRTYDSDTSPASLVYGPAEYNALTGPSGPTTGPMEPSGSNRQDDPEDREAKKLRI